MVLEIFTLVVSSRAFLLPPYLDSEKLVIYFYHLNSLKEFVLLCLLSSTLKAHKEREVVQFYAEKTLKP